MLLSSTSILHLIVGHSGHFCGLIIFSILGNLSRASLSNYFVNLSESGQWDIYLKSSNNIDSSVPIYTDYYANVLGCFFLGMINCKKDFLAKQLHAKSIVVTALSSWFCGSLTTFSSWISAVVLMIKDNTYWVALTSLLSAMAVNYCAYSLGIHFAQGITYLYLHFAAKTKNSVKPLKGEEIEMVKVDDDTIEEGHNKYHNNNTGFDPNENMPILESFLFILSATVVLIFGTLNFLKARNSYNRLMQEENEIGAEEQRQLAAFWCSIYFAPLGAGIRYGLSMVKKVKSFHKHIPFHTLLANMIGCVVASISVSRKDDHPYLFAAIKIGLGGCLSTFSTFIAEIHSIDVAYSHFYGMISIVLGLGIQSLIIYIC